MQTEKATTTPSSLSFQTIKGHSDITSTIYGDFSRGILSKNTRSMWHVLPPEIKRKIALLLPCPMDLLNLMRYDQDLCSILAYSFNLRIKALLEEVLGPVMPNLPDMSRCVELMVAALNPTLRHPSPSRSLPLRTRQSVASVVRLYSHTWLLEFGALNGAPAVRNWGRAGLRLIEAQEDRKS